MHNCLCFRAGRAANVSRQVLSFVGHPIACLRPGRGAREPSWEGAVQAGIDGVYDLKARIGLRYLARINKRIRASWKQDVNACIDALGIMNDAFLTLGIEFTEAGGTAEEFARMAKQEAAR